MEDVKKSLEQSVEVDKEEVNKLNTDTSNEDKKLTDLENPQFKYNNMGSSRKRKCQRPRRFR